MKYIVGARLLSENQVFELCMRFKRSLEGLTPGGSEYVNDPERCADFVRYKLNALYRVIIRKAAEETIDVAQLPAGVMLMQEGIEALFTAWKFKGSALTAEEASDVLRQRSADTRE